MNKENNVCIDGQEITIYRKNHYNSIEVFCGDKYISFQIENECRGYGSRICNFEVTREEVAKIIEVINSNKNQGGEPNESSV